jgi:NAD(P)-dependent dehydrogenase (short-subunit alcohol dehydrogenase family)
MNPAMTALDLVARPAGAVASVLNRPTAFGRNRPLYGLNLLDAVRGGTLEDALRDRIVLITGASSGIGATLARKLGAAGGEIVLVARSRDKLEETAAAVQIAGGTAHVYPCDLTDLAAIRELAEQVTAAVGRVDILVNNAGRSIRRSLTLSYDRMHDYERTMQLNYFGPVQLMLALLPGMRERRFGTIVNLSSIGVLARTPRFGAYVASKAALDVLCDTWQGETRADNVRFTSVHMSLVRTKMIEATTIYQQFPVLTPDEAADVLCEAIVRRPRRVSPPFGQLAAFADAVSPTVMDRVRNQGYQLFDDSAAARGEEPARERQGLTGRAQAFANLTGGAHW